jgi:hypothetical protein
VVAEGRLAMTGRDSGRLTETVGAGFSRMRPAATFADAPAFVRPRCADQIKADARGSIVSDAIDPLPCRCCILTATAWRHPPRHRDALRFAIAPAYLPKRPAYRKWKSGLMLVRPKNVRIAPAREWREAMIAPSLRLPLS